MTAAIQVNRIAKSFGTSRALDDVRLEIAEGEFSGLLGPNSAGKTTLISIVAGLTVASSGSARVMGLRPHKGFGLCEQLFEPQAVEDATSTRFSTCATPSGMASSVRPTSRPGFRSEL